MCVSSENGSEKKSFQCLGSLWLGVALTKEGPLVFQFFTVTCLPSLNKVDYYYYYKSLQIRITSSRFLKHTRRNIRIFHLSYFFPSLTFTIFLSSLSHTVLSTLLILAVCRTRVTTNSVNMTSLATSLPVAQ